MDGVLLGPLSGVAFGALEVVLMLSTKFIDAGGAAPPTPTCWS
jgi:hypothetical protein